MVRDPHYWKETFCKELQECLSVQWSEGGSEYCHASKVIESLWISGGSSLSAIHRDMMAIEFGSVTSRSVPLKTASRRLGKKKERKKHMRSLSVSYKLFLQLPWKQFACLPNWHWSCLILSRSFQNRWALPLLSFFYASLLHLVGGVVSLATWARVVSRAPQHFSFSEIWVFFIYIVSSLVISLHSSLSRTVEDYLLWSLCTLTSLACRWQLCYRGDLGLCCYVSAYTCDVCWALPLFLVI